MKFLKVKKKKNRIHHLSTRCLRRINLDLKTQIGWVNSNRRTCVAVMTWGNIDFNYGFKQEKSVFPIDKMVNESRRYNNYTHIRTKQ